MKRLSTISADRPKDSFMERSFSPAKFFIILLSCVLLSCSKVSTEDIRLFHGECKVLVNAEPKDAEILIDGIPVGHKKASVEIPCGSKQILVEKHGYVPYYAYHDVNTSKTLEVSVKLQKSVTVPDYALSSELLAQVRAGKRLRNPFKTTDGGISESDESDETSLEALGFSDGPAATSEAAMPAGDINSVDYWR